MVDKEENLYEKLILAEQRLKLVLENARDGIYHLNLQTGNYDFVSPSLERFSGYTEIEFMAGGVEMLTSLIHPADLPGIEQHIAHLQSVEKPNFGNPSIEYRFKTKEKGYRWVSDSRTLIFDEKGTLVAILGSIRDISDLKQTELQTREISRRYKYIFEKNPLPMWAYDADSHAILMVNHAAIEKYGYTEDDFLAMNMEDLSPAKENRQFFQRDSYDDHHSFTGERFHRKRDGGMINVEVLSHVIYINGRLTRLIISHDVTEREVAAKSLAFHANILKNVQESVIVMDLNGNITFWNEGSEKLFGYRAEEISGKYCGMLRIEQSESEFRKDLDNVIIRGSYHGEVCGMRKDGGIIWYDMVITPMHDLQDRVSGFIATAKDMSERRRVQEELRKSEANLRAIFDNTNKAYILLDKHYRIVAFNKTASEGSIIYFNNELKEGSSILDYIDERLKYFRNGFEKAMRGETVRAERRYKLHGHVLWFEFTYNPVLTSKGEMIGICLGVMDITERKISEEKVIEQNNDLKKLNTELDRFVYSASHDLRAPLSSVLGLIDIAEMEIKDPQPLHYFAMMKGSINRLNRFIQDIIDYSKNARLEVAKEPIDFKDVVGEVIDDLKFMDGADKISIGYDIDSSGVLLSDRSRIKILFSNLIGNSIKYHNLEQETPYIRISTHINGRTAKVIIEDNGIGIGKDHVDKVFDMFYRASYKSAGSGLGLYIVKEIVQKLHGNITVESEMGKGTKFTIMLPLS